MGRAKDIVLKVIPSNVAVPFVRKHHYSGSVVTNSQLHFGAFLDGRLHGVMSFGPSMDKRKIQGLVAGTGWNEFIELNRMAFDEVLPRNSESRCISLAIKAIKKNAPHIKWIISFADGMQCGDGTIYRASNFVLTGISSGSMWLLPHDLAKLNGGPVAHQVKIQSKSGPLSREVLRRTNGKNLTIKKYVERFGGKVLPGYMFRYIYFIDKAVRARLTVPEIPFSHIAEIGGRMARGQRIEESEI